MGTAHAFRAELWRYDGEAGWFFVSLPPILPTPSGPSMGH